MKTALVTGAAGGLGQAVCALLLQQGWTVCGLDRERRALPEAVRFVPCDLTDAASVEAAGRVLEDLRPDAIVHTAGIYDLDSLIEMDEDRLLRIFNVNLFGVCRVNRTFAPRLSKGGRIVIVSSELAPLDPLPFTGVYAITKAALEKYAWSLRMELNLLGVAVSVVRTGAIRTGLLGDSTRALDRFVAQTQTYRCNAARFRQIVDSVEARNVPPEKVARRIGKALQARRPRYVYKINRNPLLLLLNALPDRWQTAIIGRILRQ